MPRPLRKSAPLGLVLDAASHTPLHRQIGEQVRRAILERRLAPGQRLPSSRLMASELEVARGTVLLAMDQLIAEGYLVAQAASGLSVANDLPDEMLTAPRGQIAGPPANDGADTSVLSRRARTALRDAMPTLRLRGGAARLSNRAARPRGLPLRAVGPAAGARMAAAVLGGRERTASLRPCRAARRHRRLSRRRPRLCLHARVGRGHDGRAPEPVAACLAGARCGRRGLDRGAGFRRHARGAGARRRTRGAGPRRRAGLRRRARARRRAAGEARGRGAGAPFPARHRARPAAPAGAPELGRAPQGLDRRGRLRRRVPLRRPAARAACARSIAAAAWRFSPASPSCSSRRCG